MSKIVTISFLAEGFINQRIRITDPEMTPEKLIEGLNKGTIFTTIQEDGVVEYVENEKQVGIVDGVDNNLEYLDFVIV